MLATPLPVFFLTLEGSFGLYCFVCALRTLFWRRTVGLLLRPFPALTGTSFRLRLNTSFRLRLKRSLLKGLRHLPCVHTFTILPFSIEYRFSDIADGWIYDPQIWDLTVEERATPGGPLCRDILMVANGRQVCCAVGRQNTEKGFDAFTNIYVNFSALRDTMLFAFGGQVKTEGTGYLPAFSQAGGYVCNRFVTDAELLDIYAAADLIWCVYAPDYDQASGVLGRAAQLGIPVVVRRGSLVQRLCESEGLAHVAIDSSADWQKLTQIPPREDRRSAAARADRMREESLNHLREALGIPSKERPPN